MKYWRLLALFSFVPAIAFGADTTTVSFTPPQSDISVIYLSSIFGLVDGVLYGTGSQIIGEMFGIFNSAVLALGGIVLMYTLMVSTLQTAHEGEMLGRKWNTIWVPIRSLIAVALLLPKASGYCMIQIFVMWVVLQGVGAADTIWGVALDYLAAGGILIQPGGNAAEQAQQTDNEKVKVASKMLQNQVCLYGLQRTLEDVRQIAIDSGFDDPGTPPNLTTSIDFSNQPASAPADPNSPNSSDFFEMSIPQNLTGQYASLNGICGKVTWQGIPIGNLKTLRENLGRAGIDSSSGVYSDAQKARSIAIQQMWQDLEPTAQAIVDNYFISPLDDSQSQLQLGQCLNCDKDNMEWFTTNDLPALLTGYELKNAVNVYYAVLSPTLNAIGREAGDLDFIGEAKRDGWITAGAYFFDLLKLNATIQSTVSDEGSIKAYLPASISTDEDDAQMTYKIDRTDYQYPSQILLYNDFGPFTALTQPFKEFATYLSNAEKIYMRGSDDVNATDMQLNTTVDFHIRDVDHVTECNVEPLGVCLDKPVINFIIDTVVNGLIIPALNLIADGVALLLSGLAGIMASFSTSIIQSLEGGAHPLIEMASLGNTLIDLGGWTWLAGIVLALTSGLIPFNQSAMSLITFITPLITGIIIALFSYGIILSFWAPLIPYIVFLMGAIGWIVAVIEAMVAAPIVALGMLHPEGGEDVFGRGQKAIELLTNIFLRPSMMIIGYIAAIILSYIGIWLLNYTFSIVTEGLTTNLNGWAVVLAPLVILGIYCITYLNIVQESFNLITMLPDKVLRWIGAGEESTSFGKGTLDAVKGGVSSATGTGVSAAKSSVPKPRQKQEGKGDSGSSIKGGKSGGGTGGGQGGLKSTGGNAKPIAKNKGKGKGKGP